MSKEKKESLEKGTKKTKEEKVSKKESKKKETKVEKKDTKKVEKKKNVFSRIIGYFKGVRKEISRIRWTKLKELGKYSVAAVSIILFFCVYFYVIDILVALLRSSL